ncbi:MAG: dihydrolipoyl dehydrogenase [Candidatus Krumholzibacteriia bacterium]
MGKGNGKQEAQSKRSDPPGERGDPDRQKTQDDKAEPAERAGRAAQLVVIGGGPAGYLAMFRAAELGLDVTLVDPEENPGGVCLYRGCIPSKALLHAARVIREAEDSKLLGLKFRPPEIDVDRLRAWKDEVVGKLTGGLGQKARKLKIRHLRGRARFVDARTLAVELVNGGGTERVPFEQAIVATGSEPVALPGVPASDRVMDSTGALDLPEVPKSLLVIGGGYIGLELGSVYAALGSKVSVVEMTAGLLPGVDRDLVSVLKRRLDHQFERILLNTKVASLKAQKSGVKVMLENAGGETDSQRFDRVLVSIGRRPLSRDLGLENTRIEVDERGFVKVDGQRRTAERHIFAIGDVAGEPMLAHKGYAEALVAAEAAAGRKSIYEPRGVPAVVYTDPEIAWVGLSETDARAEQRKVKTAKLPWRGNGRTLTLGRDDGMTKILIDPGSRRVLGIGLVGPGAGELVAEGALALEMAAVAEDLRRTIHPHPSLSETIFDAAEQIVE